MSACERERERRRAKESEGKRTGLSEAPGSSAVGAGRRAAGLLRQLSWGFRGLGPRGLGVQGVKGLGSTASSIH